MSDNSFRINWLAHKTIDHKLVSKLLAETEENNQFTNNGPLKIKLEKTLRELLDISTNKAIIAVNNGTSALHALASGINLFHNRKLKYATQAFTFPASVQGSLNDSLICDIDRGIGLDLLQVPSDIDGIFVTNIFGNLVDLDRYVEWASEHNKILLFDNAATMATMYKGKNCCNYGHGCTISFHHTKPFGFGEGGAIIVDRIYENDVRRCLNFGIDDTHPYDREGSNYKISDIACAYILQHLANFDNICKHHTEIYDMFVTELINIPTVHLLPTQSDSSPIVACMAILFDNLNAAQTDQYLEQGIYCRKYYDPLADLPVSREIYDRIVCFPCNTNMTHADVQYIIDIIKKVIKDHSIPLNTLENVV